MGYAYEQRSLADIDNITWSNKIVCTHNTSTDILLLVYIPSKGPRIKQKSRLMIIFVNGIA